MQGILISYDLNILLGAIPCAKLLQKQNIRKGKPFIDQPVFAEQHSSPYMADIIQFKKTQTKHPNISSR